MEYQHPSLRLLHFRLMPSVIQNLSLLHKSNQMLSSGGCSLHSCILLLQHSESLSLLRIQGYRIAIHRKADSLHKNLLRFHRQSAHLLQYLREAFYLGEVSLSLRYVLCQSLTHQPQKKELTGHHL